MPLGRSKRKEKHQFLAHVQYVNLLGRNINAKKKNTEVLLVTNKEADLEGSTEKNKLIFVSREQNVGQIHNIKIAQLKTWHTSDM
jgi:Mg/Co/Ni transporter MgtE